MSSGALGHVGYFAELIDEWAPEAQVDERLYRLGSSAVDALANGVPVEALARVLRVPGSCDCRGSIRRLSAHRVAPG